MTPAEYVDNFRLKNPKIKDSDRLSITAKELFRLIKKSFEDGAEFQRGRNSFSNIFPGL